MMIGIPPNRVPEVATAGGVVPAEGIHHGTQAWTWINTSQQPAGDNDAYPESTIPAYYRAPHRGPRRTRSGQSSRPGVDFIVRRKPLDPVNSTVGPSNGR